MSWVCQAALVISSRACTTYAEHVTTSSDTDLQSLVEYCGWHHQRDTCCWLGRCKAVILWHLNLSTSFLACMILYVARSLTQSFQRGRACL